MEKIGNSNSSLSFDEISAKRKVKDGFRVFANWLFGLMSVAILIWILTYVFMSGSSYLSWDFITGDYHSKTLSYKTTESFRIENYNNGEPFTQKEEFEEYPFSSKYGASFGITKDLKGKEAVYLVSLEEGSPFFDLFDVNGNGFTYPMEKASLDSLIIKNEAGKFETVYGNASPKEFAAALDRSISIYDMTFVTFGGGIRGSLLTTLALIGLTLLFLLPLGIGAAIYLSLYAKGGKITLLIRSLIDLTSGIPSIIFGLAGALIFVPFASSITGGSGGNLLSGALTLTIMLLPVVIKTTEEAIRAVPRHYMDASLALGASKTETIFKVILPNALGGILTSSLLSVGRIVGESAALVFAMGATIGETVSFQSGYSSLAVHIWNVLSGESPAYGQASAIAIIILLTVLILNIGVKLISYFLEKKKGKRT